MDGIRDDRRFLSWEGDKVVDGFVVGEQVLDMDGVREGGVLGPEGAREGCNGAEHGRVLLDLTEGEQELDMDGNIIGGRLLSLEGEKGDGDGTVDRA